MPSLFISYRRNDSPDTVKLIHERLRRRLPRWDLFYDQESIPLGEQFPERLREEVTSAAVVLVIIGPKWLEILRERRSAAVDHVRTEVRLALETTKSVVPILVGHAAMPTEADFADFPDLQLLLQRNGRSVRPDPDFDADLEPIIAQLRQLDSDEAIGATLAGKYTLIAEIAHGGMGVVYLAEQKQPVQRTVAVKLIKPGMDSRDVLARFEAERQALAVMDHPNVAKVHDAGMTAQGRPFFVMEYVKGVPITQYCDDKKLTPQDRLNLFIPVCNAVQHAHQKGIIHRDLKPNNVLVETVDGKPVPKVIDFGLAKALGQKLTEKTLYTALDTRIGTLEYSAPEQAAGRSFDVDTRSDIYSLGVMLYELLTGAPPFTHEELLKIGEEEMRRVIREKEPTTPSKKLSSSGELPAIAAKRNVDAKKLPQVVQGDLDWIVMKCLEKEQGRRYETANQLAGELRRFLADEPVQAGPPSANYRLRKFLRRNKAAVFAAGLVALALLGIVVGMSVGLIQSERAREAEEARQLAVEREAQARAELVASEEWRTWRKAFQERLGSETITEATLAEALLKVRPPPSPDNPASALRRDFAIADVLLSYPAVRDILWDRFGIDERNFLGTGLTRPASASGTNYGSASAHEYFIKNYYSDSKSVCTRTLDPVNRPEGMRMTVADLIDDARRPDHDKDELVKEIVRRVKENDFTTPPVIRFARFNGVDFGRRLGSRKRHYVFASSLADVWHLRVRDAANRSGYISEKGDTVYLWVFVPSHASEVIPATWDQVLNHLPSWLSENDEY
jgi:serine/threonine protein kinase